MTLDLSGHRYGRLRVIGQVKSIFRRDRKRRFWLCVCECGFKGWFEGGNLRGGTSRQCFSCAVQKRTTHGACNTATYKTWASVLNRCRNPKYHGFYLYGARGIKVCKRWHKFENFLADMGERPAGKSIERKNNNGNYCKRNCCWATPLEQAQNRRTNKLSFVKAKTIRRLYKNGDVTKTQLAHAFGVSFPAICCVLDNSRWVRL